MHAQRPPCPAPPTACFTLHPTSDWVQPRRAAGGLPNAHAPGGGHGVRVRRRSESAHRRHPARDGAPCCAQLDPLIPPKCLALSSLHNSQEGKKCCNWALSHTTLALPGDNRTCLQWATSVFRKCSWDIDALFEAECSAEVTNGVCTGAGGARSPVPAPVPAAGGCGRLLPSPGHRQPRHQGAAIDRA